MKLSPRQKLGKKPIHQLTDTELESLIKGPGKKHIRADYGPAWAPIFEPNKGGRPPKNTQRKKAIELRKKGYSWAKVTLEMNRITGQAKSLNAYRNLLTYSEDYRPKTRPKTK